MMEVRETEKADLKNSKNEIVLSKKESNDYYIHNKRKSTLGYILALCIGRRYKKLKLVHGLIEIVKSQ